MVAQVWVGSPNFTRQSGITKRHITLHWMVGTLASTDAVFGRKGSGASAQYGVEGDRVHQYVEESQYAWADGNTHSNRYGISIEHAGGWLLPNGSRAHPTAATHETSAQLCADISRRHGLGKLVVGVNLFPHNHWVATMCPGTLDIHWIANRANEYLDGTANQAETDHIMRVIYNIDNKDDNSRRAVVSDLIFKPITAAQSVRENKLWGVTVNLTQGEWDAQRVSVIENRTQLGLPVVIEPNGGIGGPTDLAPVLDAIGKLPTAEQNAQAAREAIVKA